MAEVWGSPQRGSSDDKDDDEFGSEWHDGSDDGGRIWVEESKDQMRWPRSDEAVMRAQEVSVRWRCRGDVGGGAQMLLSRPLTRRGRSRGRKSC